MKGQPNDGLVISSLEITSLEDEPRSGYPSEIDNEQLQHTMEANLRPSTCNLAIALDCALSTVVIHLDAIGKRSKLGQWIPHELTDYNCECCAEVFTLLLPYNCTNDLLDSIVTGDVAVCQLTTQALLGQC